MEAAHGAEQTAETALHMGESAYHAGKLKPYRDVARAEQRLDKANVDALHQKAMRDNPQAASNPISRHRQKEAIKCQYAAAKSGKRTEQAVKGAEKAAHSAADKVKRVAESFKKHSKAYLVLGIAGVMVILLMVGGSLFGWSTPAARIASYDVRGEPIKPCKHKAKPPKDRSMDR